VAVRLLHVVIWPHVIVGLIEIGAALTTETRPQARFA
jgi:hypothetical protein